MLLLGWGRQYEEHISEVARRLRRILAGVSVETVAKTITVELLVELTTLGTWDAAKAVQTIRQMSNERQQAQGLVRLFSNATDEMMPDEVIAQAWNIALGLPKERSCRVLAALIPWLPNDHLDAAINAIAERAAQPFALNVLEAAAAIVRRLPEEACRTNIPWRQLAAMSYEDKILLTNLIRLRHRQAGAAEEALDFLVAEFDNTFERCQYLAVLIPFLPDSAIDQALDVLRGCPTEYRGDALIALALRAPPERIADLLDVAQHIGWHVPPEAEEQQPWVRLMQEVGPRLTEQTKRNAAAVATGLRIDHAAEALEVLAPYLSATAARQLLNEFDTDRVKWELASKGWEANVVVAALARQLPEPEADAVVRRRLRISQMVDNDLHVAPASWDSEETEDHVAVALAPFAAFLPPETVRRVLRTVCRGFTWTADDAARLTPSLRRLAPVVGADPELTREAVTLMAQRGGWYTAARSAILSVLAPHLPRDALINALSLVLDPQRPERR